MKDSLIKSFINYQINTLGLFARRQIIKSKFLKNTWEIIDQDFELQKLKN